MEVIDIDSEVARHQLIIAVIGVFVIFAFIGPLGGLILHRLVRRFLPIPANDVLILIFTALVVFFMSFALTLGILLRFNPFEDLTVPLMLGISLGSATLVTVITALVIRTVVKRSASRIDPDAHNFGVWGDDARTRDKNLRR